MKMSKSTSGFGSEQFKLMRECWVDQIRQLPQEARSTLYDSRSHNRSSINKKNLQHHNQLELELGVKISIGANDARNSNVAGSEISSSEPRRETVLERSSNSSSITPPRSAHMQDNLSEIEKSDEDDEEVNLQNVFSESESGDLPNPGRLHKMHEDNKANSVDQDADDLFEAEDEDDTHPHEESMDGEPTLKETQEVDFSEEEEEEEKQDDDEDIEDEEEGENNDEDVEADETEEIVGFGQAQSRRRFKRRR